MAVQQLARVPRITFGAGARRKLADLASGLVTPGSAVLLAADPGLGATGMIDDVANLLRAGGFGVEVFTDIKSDPSFAQTDTAAATARTRGAKLVVALGGGSALDLGKAAACTAAASESAAHYALCAHPLPETRLRTICIPTTAGTGSETTRNSVLTGADGAKRWLWGDELKPDEVVLDPELAFSLPPLLTAATALDALVHAVEAATNRNAFAANDLFAHEAIRLVARHLEAAVSEPRNVTARAGLALAAALAGTAIDNAGTAIAHNIGHALASLHPIHHGRAVGIAMLASLPWNIEGNEEAFAACAVAMGAEPTAKGFIAAYESLCRRVGLDLSLGRSDVTPEALAEQMGRPENAAMLRSNRREPSAADRLILARAVLAVA